MVKPVELLLPVLPGVTVLLSRSANELFEVGLEADAREDEAWLGNESRSRRAVGRVGMEESSSSESKKDGMADLSTGKADYFDGLRVAPLSEEGESFVRHFRQWLSGYQLVLLTGGRRSSVSSFELSIASSASWIPDLLHIMHHHQLSAGLSIYRPAYLSYTSVIKLKSTTYRLTLKSLATVVTR